MDNPSDNRADAAGVEHEDVLSLADAAKFLPVRKEGKPFHVNTLHRWATAGVRGVVLESLMIGGARYTSRQALTRFIRRISRGIAEVMALTEKPRRLSTEVLRRSGIAEPGADAGGGQ